VDLLETTIYDQAALFFGVHVHQKATTLLGKSRRVQNSINLVVSKNLLTKELETILDPEARTLITTRLNSVKNTLRLFRRGEKNRKNRWKRKKALSEFSKNPFARLGKTF